MSTDKENPAEIDESLSETLESYLNIKFEDISCKTVGQLIKLGQKYPYLLSCYSPGYLLMWREYFNASYTTIAGCVVIKACISGKEEFFFPYCYKNEGDINIALGAIERYCTKKSIPLSFYIVPREMMPFVALRYDNYTVNLNRNESEYIYLSKDMQQFSGKKYSGQRNHINKFTNLFPNAIFRPLNDTDEEKKKLEKFWNRFEDDFQKNNILSARYELKKAREMLLLPCSESDFAAIVELEGEIVSFCFGEIIGDILIIHIEKSLDHYPGVYQFMVKNFAEKFGQGVKYINRQDDEGSRGLRISKTQYQPIKIEEQISMQVHSELIRLKKIPSLKSERLTYSQIKKDDIPKYNRLCLDEELNKYWGYDYHDDLQGELTYDYFYHSANSDFTNKVGLSMAIRLKKQLIGEVVINEFNFRGSANIGIRLLPEYIGKGYGKEALATICDFALYNIGLKRVTAYCYRENIVSYKMLKSVMTSTGEDETFYYFRKTV
ncbi:MAG: GNAT family N-acetyltransferase [Erysipelotrichia bacterium]|nr:GNAT family N-acetyltransferase [Erysipelotrichia bacterium]